MGQSRFILGVVCGGAAVYLLAPHTLQPSLVTLPSSPMVVDPASVRPSAVEGPRVRTRLLGPEEAVRVQEGARQAGDSRAGAAHSSESVQTSLEPSLPSDDELRSELVRLGISESKARAMLAQFGPVKMKALIERERQQRAIETSPASSASANATSVRASTTARDTSSANANSPEPSSPEAENMGVDIPDDPYEQLRTAAAASPAQTEEEILQHRQDRFAAYVESVHAGEKEVLRTGE